MAEFKFEKAPQASDAADISGECQRQLQPVVKEIVQAAVAAGWNQKDILLAMIDVAWDLYENHRDDH
ncbi:hypothetical protein [Rhizobium lusitanum]|uniref:Uncharacterized protein n=1 Tax=Rhizobium lusitanum TaxID=293958 RepID=A0A7X0IV56_9HYPH|nr:hypothetical protein [Rhizobium lusitanum]MBB6486602.1 hypothetical protein [Rhizobium lusitanum]